jgi:hypothetical protein
VLKDLLAEVAKADYLSKLSLAQKLEQPVGLIEDGLEQLVRLGYLKEDGGLQNCELPCGKCPYASMCQTTPIKMMALTKKGFNLLADH